MKYTVEIEIDKPVDEVIKLFDNTENLYKWMHGLQSMEHISGEPGQPGAKSKMQFKMGNRDIEMIETITVRNLPEEFTGTYEAKGVFNIVKNKFEALPENRTRYITEQEFKFSGFMKVIGATMPGSFKKESMKYLKNFKDFAEKS